MKKLLSVVMMLLSLTSVSQVVPNKDWVVQVTNGGIDIHGIAAAVDYTSGAVYSCGYMNTVSNGKDVVVVKLDSNGVQLWSASYNYNTANLDDKANAICVDPSGNVYVTGYSQAASNNADIIVIKYNSSGTQQWATRLAGNANADDCGNSIGVDGSGNVYVAGYLSITGKGKDFSVSKFNSSGVHQGSLKLNGSASSDEAAEKLTISGTNLFATGCIKNTSTNKDVLTICVAMAGPTVTWSTTVNGSSSSDDTGLDVKTYGSDVYICGKTNNTTTGEDYYFAKMAQSNGAVGYSNTYDGGYNGSDFATSLVSDNTGNFGITGIVTNGSNTEYHTQMYNTSSLLWTHIQPQNGAYSTIYPKIAVDTIAYHYYVCGAYFNGTQDAILYQVDPTGVKRWTQYHDGAGGARDVHADLAVNGLGQIYVASANETGTSTNSFDYNIIRYSQTPVYAPIDSLYEGANQRFAFYQNRGQVIDSAGNPVNDIVAYTDLGVPGVYLKRNSFSYVLRKHDSVGVAIRDSVHRVDVTFTGDLSAYTEPTLFEEAPTGYLNYYNTQYSMVEDLKGYNRAIVPNIYPYIDLHYYSNASGLKYYFVVKQPFGGSYSAITFSLSGQVSDTINGSGDLVMKTSLGDITWDEPYAYQVDSTLNVKPLVSVWNRISNDVYNVTISSTIDPNLPIVIEVDHGNPISTTASSLANIDWSTFYGSTAPANHSTVFRSIVADKDGNTYVSGYTNGNNFPITAGAQAFGGNFDAVLLKFNKNGVRKWSTYFGSSTSQCALDGVLDTANVTYYCTGYSNGVTPVPALQPSGAYVNTSYSGNDDVFIIKTDTLGKLKWSILYGSSGEDQPWDINVDHNDNLYIVGEHTGGGTFSTYTKTNAYNNSVGAGFIMKFNNVNQRDWITKFGNKTFNGQTQSIAFDLNNDFYIGGSTKDSLYTKWVIGASNDTTYNGGFKDLFIAKFKGTNDSLTWCRYIGGSNIEGVGSGPLNRCVNIVCKDDISNLRTTGAPIPGKVYITGISYSSDYPLYKTTGQFIDSTTTHEGVITAFNADLTLAWSTKFGNAEMRSIIKDANNNILIAGQVQGSNLITKSYPGSYYQSSNNTSGATTGMLAIFDSKDSLINSTYIGGSSYEALNSITKYKNYIYVAGETESFSFSPKYPLIDLGGTPPAWYDTISGGGCITRLNFSNTLYSSTNDLKVLKVLPTNILLYPNPNNGSFILKFLNELKGQISISVYNSIGQKLTERTIKDIFKNHEELFNLDNTTSGIYFVNISSESSHDCIKIIKY
jgi:hypothetical protein